MEYLTLIILWTGWCLIHSGMILPAVTGYLKSRLGAHYRFYRLFYNMTALVTLIPVFLYSQGVKGAVLFRWEGYMTAVQMLLLAAGMSLFIAGGLKYDLRELLGIRQIKTGRSGAGLSESGGIDTSGILGVTRHPWYLAGLVIIWTGYRELYVSTAIVNTILTVYLIIGTILEERKLIIEFGDSYRDYRRRVSMLFPAKWIFSRFFAAGGAVAAESRSADPSSLG